MLRVCFAPSQVAFDQRTNSYILSDQIFSAMGPGVSVDIAKLYQAAGRSHADRIAQKDEAFAALLITAAAARAVEVKDSKGKAAGKFQVAYTPLNEAEHGIDNPFHGDIFPKPSPSAMRQLKSAANVIHEIDQEAAAEAYSKKRNL